MSCNTCVEVGIPGPPGQPGIGYLGYADTMIQFRAVAWDGSAHLLRSQPGHLALVDIHGAEGAYLQIYNEQLAGNASAPVWTEWLDAEHVQRLRWDPWLWLSTGCVLRLTDDAAGAVPYSGGVVTICARHR